MSDGRPAGLELRDVVKHYRVGDEVVRAVDGVSLEVEPGEVVALIGPSGSGKSTLLLLAAGFASPDAGQASYRGQDLARMSDDQAVMYQRHAVGFITQSFHLMPGVPAVENAAVKLLADRVPLHRARQSAQRWLQRVGLAHRMHHTPDQLSGGERQRVAIARALVNEPSLILADEPTGSLDSRRGQEILELLAGIGRDQRASILLVTHDPRAAEVCDRVLTLTDGRLATPRHGRQAAYGPSV